MKTVKLEKLSYAEMRDTNGGYILELIGVYCAVFAICYQIGKDAKERTH